MRRGPRPLIGVTTYRQVSSWWAWEQDAALVPGAYLDMVEAAGGQPVLVPPSADGAVADADPDRWTGFLRSVDGLVLIGGGDLEPARYGREPDPRTGGVSSSRDDLELSLLGSALERGLPLLAVCRGMQVLNVALGGDLVQHLPDELGSTRHQPRPGAFGTVEVATREGSAIRDLLGARTEVSCSHHQAVGRLGAGLEVTATSDDGVVEAVELPGSGFVVGVQWHPEARGDVRLFRGLVAAMD